MKILSNASYKRLLGSPAPTQVFIDARDGIVAHNAALLKKIDLLERGRTDYQERLLDLERVNMDLRAKLSRVRYNCNAAEQRVQELTLLLGMKGFAVEMTPDIPATPARPGVLTLTKVAK